MKNKEEIKAISKEWMDIIDQGGKAKAISCPNIDCDKSVVLLFDNTGTVRHQSPEGNSFLLLNTVDITAIINNGVEHSIRSIWGCPHCKGLTFTNCTLALVAMNGRMEIRVIKAE